MRNSILSWIMLAGVSLPAGAATPVPLEKEIEGLVAGPEVTVVHFWAPWCPNCMAEMKPDGWAAFIAANPNIRFVFLNIWHRGMDPGSKLAGAGLGSQSNLILRTHPNAASSSATRLDSFLGRPVTWLPTTWVFKDGRQYFALNYGEVRFPMLQQLLDDSTAKWNH